MSSSFTLDDLTAALQSWPQDGNAEYVAAIPRMIRLAEDRLIVELNLEIFDLFDTQNLLAGDAFPLKPANMLAERGLFIVTNLGGEVPVLNWQRLVKRSYEFCANWWPDGASSGTPKYYCEVDDLTWEIPFPPATDYQLETRYIVRPASLTAGAGAGTTWLSSRCGDLLFASSLMESEHYLKADDRYADMRDKYYKELLPSRMRELRVAMRNGDFSPLKPGAAPTKGA